MNCEIRVNGQLLPLNVWGGYIIAQKQDSQRDPSGFVFYRGHVSRNGRVFLGRAWGPYSRVIFQKTKFDIDVAPKGWMIGTRLGKGNMVYLEQDYSGKGSNVNKRAKWSQHNLIESKMQPYTRANFIQDEWLATQPGTNY
ncbi:putative pectinesterase 52 [Vitis vinifera]|uniref:pectinesterase n=1 Tax=Vitis vinifera TaxID=29760 RepID=A0A438DUM4_VITVI|nr:putative pectinesterase 52 [Vitis vinifera]